MEERVAKLEGAVEQVVLRLNHLENEIRDLRKEIAELRARIDSNFRWTIGILITMWVTIILSSVFAALL